MKQGKVLTDEWVFVDKSLWGDEPANVTNSEYLNTWFRLDYHRHENWESFNSFSLVSFLPSTNFQDAILYLKQTWNEEKAKGNTYYLKQTIREAADADISLFEATCGTPEVYKRWIMVSPRSHIIIRHVRAKDIQETLAVTMDGITSFDEEDFKKAQQKVKVAGGIW